MAREILDRLPQSVLLLDWSGTILADNESARRLLEEGDPLISDRSGGIRGRDLRATTEMNQLLAHLGSGETGDVAAASLQRRDGTSSLQVVARRLRRSRAGIDGLLLTAADPARVHTPPPVLLEQLFALTPREARIASAIVSGVRADDVASQMRIAKNTVRTHLKNIYAKTGVRTQAELVRAIYCGPLWFPALEPR